MIVHDDMNDVPGARRSTSAAGERRPFDHFLITRFNVRSFYHWHEITDEWLRERLELFNRYCVPSVMGQTAGNFRWLVFFDAGTPEWFRRIVGTEATGRFEPVYVEGYFDHDVVSAEVKKRTTADFVITSRLDNDDAIASDFMEVVQGKFRRQGPEFINLLNGAQHEGSSYYLRPYTKNPFLSLVESANGDIQSVLVEHHYKVDEVAPVMNVRTSHPMWLQVLHGGNVLNDLVGLRVPSGKVAPYFSCELTSRDSLMGLVSGVGLTGARIVIRLLRRPHRLVELLVVVKTRQGGRPRTRRKRNVSSRPRAAHEGLRSTGDDASSRYPGHEWCDQGAGG